jgi:hypothetical protein
MVAPVARAVRSLPSGPDTRPLPPASGDLTSWPRFGTSLYNLLCDTAWDAKAFARILGDHGCTLTDVWGLSAQWIEQVNDLILPFKKRGDGQWDLFDWNPAYFDRAEMIVAEMNARGVLVQFTLTELYTWSQRKQGLPGVPDANAGPWRRNVNGIHWGIPDDDVYFETEPKEWLTEYITRIVGRLKGAGVVWRLGNEMPEKGLHERLRDVVKRADPSAQTVINREDVPGMYANMRIGKDYDRIEYHGLRDLSTLETIHDNGSATERPDTFRKLLNRPDTDCKRIVLSSDGCRASSTDLVNTYDWNALFAVAKYGAERGCSYSHQSRAKMTRIVTGRADLGAIETDFLDRLRSLY